MQLRVGGRAWKKLRLAQLIIELRELSSLGDPEIAHGQADDLLLEYIGEPGVSEAFKAIDKWYA